MSTPATTNRYVASLSFPFVRGREAPIKNLVLCRLRFWFLRVFARISRAKIVIFSSISNFFSPMSKFALRTCHFSVPIHCDPVHRSPYISEEPMCGCHEVSERGSKTAQGAHHFPEEVVPPNTLARRRPLPWIGSARDPTDRGGETPGNL